MIDETHKDRNAARRRRGWKRRNSNAEIQEWYRYNVRYTLLAAADVNGFIPCACHTVLRDHISEEGAAGTVDTEYFEYWVETYLCPVLGKYEFGESRSVVLLDNASTHMSERVQQLIYATGATIIYGAPYSPHLNPIENYFSIYKAYLKRNTSRMHSADWKKVHEEALQEVNRDTGIRFFRRCKVPGSEDMLIQVEYY
jgi:transposase